VTPCAPRGCGCITRALLHPEVSWGDVEGRGCSGDAVSPVRAAHGRREMRPGLGLAPGRWLPSPTPARLRFGSGGCWILLSAARVCSRERVPPDCSPPPRQRGRGQQAMELGTGAGPCCAVGECLPSPCPAPGPAPAPCWVTSQRGGPGPGCVGALRPTNLSAPRPQPAGCS